MSYGPEVFRQYLDILDEKNQVNEAPQLTPAMQNQADSYTANMTKGTEVLARTLGSKGAKDLPGVTPKIQADANKVAGDMRKDMDKMKATPGVGPGASLRGMDVNKTHGGEDGADLDNLGGTADPANVRGTAAGQREVDRLRGKK